MDMKQIVLGVLLLGLVGCATGYQSYTWSGGYKDTEIAKDHYLVEYYGNGTTSAATVAMFWEQRANELCPSGYDVVGGETGATDGGIFIGVTVNHPWQKAEIRCK